MTNKLVVIINSLKVPKIKKVLLYEMKFLVPNYSCLQNPWLWGYRPQIPILSVLCAQLNLLNPPRTKFLGTPLVSKCQVPISRSHIPAERWPQDSHHDNEQFVFCTLWHYSILHLAGLPKPRTLLSSVALTSLPYSRHLSAALGTFKQPNGLPCAYAFFLCIFNCFSHVLPSAGISVAFFWVFSHGRNWNQNSHHILRVKQAAAGLFYPQCIFQKKHT